MLLLIFLRKAKLVFSTADLLEHDIVFSASNNHCGYLIIPFVDIFRFVLSLKFSLAFVSDELHVIQFHAAPVYVELSSPIMTRMKWSLKILSCYTTN